MAGEIDLKALMRSLDITSFDEVFVFATLKDRCLPDGVNPQMVFQEAEGTTLILRRSEAENSGIAYDFPCRMITLNVHSALEAVGFIAAIASALAGRGISVNPVAGFYHDHLFVPDGKQEQAIAAIRSLASRYVAED